MLTTPLAKGATVAQPDGTNFYSIPEARPGESVESLQARILAYLNSTDNNSTDNEAQRHRPARPREGRLPFSRSL